MLKKIFHLIAFTLMTIAVSSQAQVAGFVDGTHYRTLDKPLKIVAKDKVEVAGVFWYGCPHCADVEPLLEKWSNTAPDYINFVNLPAIFSKRWEFHAKAFYTIEALGIKEQAHQAIFDRIHKNRKSLSKEKQLIEFLSNDFNQDATRVEKTLNSFGVKAKVGAAKSLTRQAGLTFVPAVIIDGKYVTSVSQAGTEENLLKVIHFLAEKAKNEKV